MKYHYDEYLSALEGAAKTQGQSVPSDLNVVRADLVLYGVLKGLHEAVEKLDQTSTRLYMVNIGLSVVMIAMMVLQVFIAARP
jgi:hypothetical protein